MKKVLKSRLTAGVLIVVVVCLSIVLAGDVIVEEGTLEAENIDATGTIEAENIDATGYITGRGIIGLNGVQSCGALLCKNDGEYYLYFNPVGSGATAHRTLNIEVNNANRTLTLTGNPTLGDWFDQSVKQVANVTFDELTITSDFRIKDDLSVYNLSIQQCGTTMTSNRVLTIDMDDAHRTLTFSGNPTLGNWFDQSVKQAASPTFRGIDIDLDGNGNSGTLKLGAGQNAGIWYDGTHLHIDPALFGSGTVIIDNLPTADPIIKGALWIDGNRFLKVSAGPPPPKK